MATEQERVLAQAFAADVGQTEKLFVDQVEALLSLYRSMSELLDSVERDTLRAELARWKARFEAKADQQIVALRLENWQGAVEKLQIVKGAEYVGEVEFRSVVNEALELLTKVDDGLDVHREEMRRAHAPTEPSYDADDGKLELRDWERAAYEARVAPRVTFNEAMLAGVVARIFGLEFSRAASDGPYDPVPAEVHERGWQWRPIDPGTAFAPPFGTIRVCSCGCLVVGGPSVCGRCPPLDAEEQLPRGDAKDLTGCDV